MYKRNERLRGANEKIAYTAETQAEYIKCSQDFEYWAEKYAKIVTLKDGVSLITFRPYQKRMMKTITSLKRKNKRGMVVLAPRQCGKTTAIYLYLLWFMIFNPHKAIAVIANKASNAEKILASMQKTFELLPLWMQPGLTDRGWNARSMEFANGSKLITGSATSDSIRGGSFNVVYLDEYAFLPRHVADDFMKSVLPTILSDDDARIFTTSTPKGLNQFHTMWKKANKGNSLYEPCRVRWEEVPNYRKPGFKDLIVSTEGMITWKQEFECSFIGSSKTLISSQTLEEPTNIDPIRKELDGLFEMWKEPEAGKTYILGVDTAKGVGGDYSVVQVCRIDNLRKIEQVALFRSNMTSIPDFAQIVISISQYYNKAEIMIENNDYGHIVAEKIWNVYDYDLIVNFEKDILGIRSNGRTKALANTTLREYVDNGYLVTNSDTTWGEYSTYEEVKQDKFEAISGEHDDTVTAMLWVMYYLKASDEYAEDVETIINPRFKIFANGEGRKSQGVTPNFNPTKSEGDMDFLDDEDFEFETVNSENMSNLGDADGDGDWLDDL